MTVYVAFDLETTGFRRSDGHRLIEIAAWRFDENGNELGVFSMLVNPRRAIPGIVQQLTHIPQALVAEGVSEAEAVAAFKLFAGDAQLVGQGAREFDVKFLGDLMPGISKAPLLDTLYLSYALNPNDRQHNLAVLAARYGVVHQRPHRAFDDAKATGQVFLKFLELAKALPPAELQALRQKYPRSNTGPGLFFHDVVNPASPRPPQSPQAMVAGRSLFRRPTKRFTRRTRMAGKTVSGPPRGAPPVGPEKTL